MGWMTLAEAQAGANTTESTNAAAKTVFAWLKTRKHAVTISHVHPIETVYSRNGITCKQEYDHETVEIRGIALDLAEWLAMYLQEDTSVVWDMYGLDKDGEIHTCQCTYGPAGPVTRTLGYRKGGNGTGTWTTDYHNYPVMVSSTTDTRAGRKVEVSNARANEADGYRVTVDTIVYFCPKYDTYARTFNPAFIPCPPNEAKDGIVVSTNKQKVLIAYEVDKPIYQNTTSVVKEYRYLTASEAATKVNEVASNGSRVIDVRVVVSWGTSGTTYKNIQVRGGGTNGTTAATDITATSRPMGNGYYVVSANEVTYQVTNS